MTTQTISRAPQSLALRLNAVTHRTFWTLVLATALVLVQAIQAMARPESFADLADKFSPAVVNITTSTMVAGRDQATPMVPEGSPFEDFFRDFQDRNRGERAPRRSSALGSGFVISEDGYIVTTKSRSNSSTATRLMPNWSAPTKRQTSPC